MCSGAASEYECVNESLCPCVGVCERIIGGRGAGSSGDEGGWRESEGERLQFDPKLLTATVPGIFFQAKRCFGESQQARSKRVGRKERTTRREK